jgi:hypothetical protein
MSKFTEIFLKFTDFDFEISQRGGTDFTSISEKMSEIKCQKHIIDMSINGYSSKETFDFEINKVKWSEIKENFKKGEEAQKDTKALTVKRAIRIMAESTTEYIITKKPTLPMLKYNEKISLKYAHLGAQYIIPEKEALQLLLLWQNFDNIKKTNIEDSVRRILNIRFDNRFL